jgi:hypothetical protein
MQEIRLRLLQYGCLLSMVAVFGSCSSFTGTEYSRLVKRELAKGTRTDNIFFGLSLGMRSKAFYDRCWELNKKGLFTNGNDNTTVLYKVEKGLKYPASMDFYPDFYQGKISRMKVSFQYNAWAPWNKPQWADSLLPDVLNLYKTWYPQGNPFISITDQKRGTIYVKVDGNRRITIGKFNDVKVKVDYADLLIEDKQKK